MTSPEQLRLTEHVKTRLLEHRILVLDTELDQENGTQLCSQFFLLAADDSRTDINLWINSPGGSVPAMLAIMDTMRLIPNDVSTLAIGLACSAGQFLLSAGTKGKRYALPHARILMHQGSAGIVGSAVEIELQAEDLRRNRDITLNLISDFTGQSVQRIHDDSLRDKWYTAEEARDYGFIDGILDSLDVIRPQPKRVGLGANA